MMLRAKWLEWLHEADRKTDIWFHAIIGFIKQHRLGLIFGVLYFILTLHTILNFINTSQLGDIYYRATFQGMYNGQAWKPFVYRVLVPKTARAITDMTPDVARETVSNWVWEWKTSPEWIRFHRTLPWLHKVFPNKNEIYPRLITILLLYGCLWGYVYFLFKMGVQLFPHDNAIRWLAPVMGLLVASTFTRPAQYQYDLSLLFLSTACYYYMASQRLGLYAVFFILACLNKETAIFILIFFTLWFYNRLPARIFVPMWAIQCLIYVLIKVILTFNYMQNPGVYLEDGLFRVLNSEVFGRSNLYRILYICLMIFLLTFKWQEKPLFLRYGLWLVPVIYLAFIVYGWPGEYRVFMDIMPLMVLLATHTLFNTSGISSASFFKSSPRHPVKHASLD